MSMKKDRKKSGFPPSCLGAVLAVWGVLLGLSRYTGDLKVSGYILVLAIIIIATGFACIRRKEVAAFFGALGNGLGRFSGRHGGVLRRGVAVLCTVTLTLSMIAMPAAAVSGSLSDTKIGLSESAVNAGTAPTTGTLQTNASSAWTVSNGTTITGTVKPAVYLETKPGSCGTQIKTYYYSTGANATLTITNNSTEECILSFAFTVPSQGTLSIDGEDQKAATTYSNTLSNGASVTVKLTTPTTASSTDTSSADTYAASVTLSDVKLTSTNKDVNVTFMQPTSGGSYTAKMGSTALTIGETYSNPTTTEYTLSATAAVNYVFDGWYVNGVKVSDLTTYTGTFTSDSEVQARFVEDSLYSIVALSEGTSGSKADYVQVNSSYYHATNRSSHTNVGDLSKNNSYGARTYFSDPKWSPSSSTVIQSTTSGTATGDNQTSMGFSEASASIYSDIIRVKCLQNCVITFDCSMTANTVSISNNDSGAANTGVYFYYYTTTSASANASTIKSNGTAVVSASQKSSGSAAGTEVVVNEGEYLYFYAYAITRKDAMKASGYATDNYSYTAKISNFTITPNTTEYTFTTGNIDNTKAQLKSGSIKINGVTQSVSSGSYTASMAGGSVLTLTPGTAPTGYVFIGWYNATDDTYLYTSGEYDVTMSKDYAVYPVYVPVMTITTGGANGYESASYTYTNLSKQTVTPNGQYVARNANCTAFYANLNEAFSGTDTVVLLAGDTINGDLTIPDGKTLVIPDRLADTGPTSPEQVTTSSGVSSYCKVTFSGNLTVNGTLVVSAVQSSAASGRANGGIGFLNMSASSTVTVNSGGVLCGFGEIRGGSITAKNGAVVREFMEISDKRAVLVMNNINDQKDTKGVFPFSNFSVKTIESTVTYETGAKLYAQYSVLLEGGNGSSGEIPLIGPSGFLFNLTAGTMTKSFDLATDKTIYRVDEGGVVTTGGFTLSLNFAAGGLSQTVTIKTTDYWMPLNAGFDIRTAGDLTMASSFKFLPGACLSVEKTGTCTIESGRNLLFYRLNDYDTRGVGSSTYQKGYSAKAYPVNATNLPGGGYKHPTLTTVGSARLNVDGTMIVNGGLYVSNDLVKNSDQGITYKETVNGEEKTRAEINDAYFTLYDNGYNVLTGTGSVDLTHAVLSKTVVYEAMTATNTNDPAFDEITITPIAGLKLESVEDAQGNYSAFTSGNIFYGVYRPYDGGIYVWGTEIPEVAVIIGEGDDTRTYMTLADAVIGYAGTGYVKMIDNSTEPGFTLGKDLYLDLNGKTVTLTSGLNTGSYKLYGMDSATDDYDGMDAGKISGTVSGTVAPVVQTELKADSEYSYYRYVAIKNGDELSFHRFNISVNGYRFELSSITPECALFFLGKFRGDSTARDYLKSVGFTLSDSNGTIATPSFALPADASAIPVVATEDEASDSMVVFKAPDTYLFEAYLIRALEKENPTTYQNQFGAVATVTFNNDESWTSEKRKLSYLEAWQNVNASEIGDEDKARLNAFLRDLGEDQIS